MLTRLGSEGGVDLAGIKCGGVTGSFNIAGSSTVFPVAQLWSEIYMAKCPGITVSYEGGGSSRGANRVCDTNAEGLGAVEIGVSRL